MTFRRLATPFDIICAETIVKRHGDADWHDTTDAFMTAVVVLEAPLSVLLDPIDSAQLHLAAHHFSNKPYTGTHRIDRGA